MTVVVAVIMAHSRRLPKWQSKTLEIALDFRLYLLQWKHHQPHEENMVYKYLRLHRPETGTNLIVKSPIEFAQINEQISLHLDRFVQCDYNGFHISDVWTEDQKKMSEVPLTQ